MIRGPELEQEREREREQFGKLPVSAAWSGLDDYDDEYGEYGDYDGYAYADIGDYDGDRIATVIVVAAYGDYDGYAYDLDDDDYYGFDENAQENAIAFADSRDEWLAGCGSTRWIRMDRVQRCGAVEWSGVQWSG